MNDINLITNEEHYSKVITSVTKAKKFVWIGTADIKDLHIKTGSTAQPFLSVLNSLLQKKVAIRLLHSKEPGKIFRNTFDKYPLLWKAMERQLCPRVHFKIIIIDGKLAYTGSANLTGAGLGMKSPNTRNFESGILTKDTILVNAIMNQFDEVWMGKYCKSCKRRTYCQDPIV